MAATKPRRIINEGPLPESVRIPAGVGNLYPGTIGCTDSTGNMFDGADTAGFRVAGILEGGGAFTVAASDNIPVYPGGRVKLKNSSTYPLTKADENQYCYLEDNETVARRTDHMVQVGLVKRVDTDGVLVEVLAAAVRP